MKRYFFLQFVMTNRKLREAGINPVLGYILGLAAFLTITEFIYYKTEFAKYLFILICMTLLFRLSEKNKSDFLFYTYGDNTRRKIRIIENVIVSSPFLAFLIFKNDLFEAAILLVLSVITAIFPYKTDFSITIPSPFSKRPFEFTTGFRKTFFVFPIVYSLTITAMIVDNLNLGIFSMILIYLISSGYYLKPENEYYVWIYSDKPKFFLLKKLLSATRNILFLNIPILICLLFFYPRESGLILLFFISGLFLFWTVILAKYSTYPKEMNLPEIMLIGISIYFPPMLLVVMPYFYFKSTNKLKAILND